MKRKIESVGFAIFNPKKLYYFIYKDSNLINQKSTATKKTKFDKK